MTSNLPRPSECRDCHDPIRFVRLDTGKAIPVNPRPGDTGNVAAHLSGGRLVGYVTSHARPALPRDLRFMPHAATCPGRPR